MTASLSATANAGRPWPMPDSIDTEGKSLWELVEARAARTPDKVMAVDEQDRTWTYEEFRDRCERVAAGLAARGVGEGTNVSWILPSRIEAFVLIGALARLGAVQNPILPIYRHREVGFITRQTGCRLLVVPGTFRDVDYEKMAREATADLDVEVLVADPDLPEGDPADARPARERRRRPAALALLHVGHGRRPEGRASTPTRASRPPTSACSGRCGATPTDRVAVVFPITHVGGVRVDVQHDGDRRRAAARRGLQPRGLRRVFLAGNGVTVAGAGTVFWQAYLAAQRKQPDRPAVPRGADLRRGRRAQAAAHPRRADGGDGRAGDRRVGPHRVADQHDDGARRPDDKKATTEGRACPGVELRVVTVDGRARPTGRGGRAAGARAAGVPRLPRLEPRRRRVHDDPTAASAGSAPATSASIDDDGYVTITGRLKDIIIRKGENISAKEIEDLLFAHPKVADVAVVGVPDPASGERACAVVVVAPGEHVHVPRDDRAPHERRPHPQKLPEQLELVDALPRNPSGKVLKRELRQQFVLTAVRSCRVSR